jgi:hypothetical protein
MEPICLSLVPILRCVSFTQLQSAILLLPLSLEVPFCVALIVLQWSSSDLWVLHLHCDIVSTQTFPCGRAAHVHHLSLIESLSKHSSLHLLTLINT